MAVSNSAKQQVEPRMSAVSRVVFSALQGRQAFKDARHAENKKKIQAGTHRFDIHPGQVIFLRPTGTLVDREEDCLQRLARNAAAIKRWNSRYVEVTDDGFIVRERDMPKAKPKLRVVRSDGR